eukprot:2028216-Pyramimonas_sp.AAC.1
MRTRVPALVQARVEACLICPESSLRAIGLQIRSWSVVVPASSPSSQVQNLRSSSCGVAAGPGAFPARVYACLH